MADESSASFLNHNDNHATTTDSGVVTWAACGLTRRCSLGPDDRPLATGMRGALDDAGARPGASGESRLTNLGAPGPPGIHTAPTVG
jgi:hypothetical protein